MSRSKSLGARLRRATAARASSGRLTWWASSLAHSRTARSPWPLAETARTVRTRPRRLLLLQGRANGAGGCEPFAAAPEKSTQPLVHFDNNTNGNANGHPPPHATTLAHSGWAASLRDQTQALIDVYAD